MYTAAEVSPAAASGESLLTLDASLWVSLRSALQGTCVTDQEIRVGIENDMAVIADLEIKGQAFFDALEKARPAIERLRLAAVRGRSSAGVLARLAAHELDSSVESEPVLDQMVEMASARNKG
jgi:hypothetical protein